jgi:hypothetical protein
MAPQGTWTQWSGTVQDPIGLSGTGITVPFTFATIPSRVSAACNGNLLRVAVQNGNIPTQPNQEWWYDFGRQIWTGPHTFPNAIAQPWQSTFVIAPIGVPHSLWQSDYFASNTSTFVENGAMMLWRPPSLLPDADQITNNAVTEGSMDLALPPTSTINVDFLAEDASPINGVAINPNNPTAPPIWGSVTWGAFIWGGGGEKALAPYQLPWSTVIVFARGAVQANGNSILNLKVSTIHLRYQVLKALVNVGQAA